MARFRRGNRMGKPQHVVEVSRVLDDYSASARYFARNVGRLTHKHPDMWVAVYKSRVCAVADTFYSLVDKLKEQEIPTRETIARRLETTPKTLIL